MSENASSSSLALCPSCLAQNPAEAHFCARCNAPMSSMAAIDPIWRLWAQGHVVRKAVHRPDRPIVLVGIWLMFGTSVVILGGNLLILLSNGSTDDQSLESAAATAALFLFRGSTLALLSTILFFTTRNYLRLRSQATESFSQE